MRRYLCLTIIGLIAFPGSALTRPSRSFGPTTRGMSPSEASEIANYWVRSYLRRDADTEEVKSWAQQLLNSRSPANVLSAFLGGHEYYHYAGGTPNGYIRKLIEDVGHRKASPYEIRDRLQTTAGGNPRDIAYRFLMEHPANWWPGPAATPPPELEHLYRQNPRKPQRYIW